MTARGYPYFCLLVPDPYILAVGDAAYTQAADSLHAGILEDRAPVLQGVFPNWHLRNPVSATSVRPAVLGCASGRALWIRMKAC